MKLANFKRNPLLLNIRYSLEYFFWVLGAKKGAAPYFYKWQVIRKYALGFNIPILVETGTYLGDTVNAMKNVFKYIYSIELSRNLFLEAQQKFALIKNIKILEGDSAIVLPALLPSLTDSILFWLDGHYSGGQTAQGILQTPIVRELESIFNFCHQPFVILIDDARLFTGQDDYPLLVELRAFVLNNNRNLEFKVENDIIRIYAADTGFSGQKIKE